LPSPSWPIFSPQPGWPAGPVRDAASHFSDSHFTEVCLGANVSTVNCQNGVLAIREKFFTCRDSGELPGWCGKIDF
jgi:hypothetical protein